MIQTHLIKDNPKPNYLVDLGVGVAAMSSSLWVIKSVASIAANQHAAAFQKYCTSPSESTYCSIHKFSENLMNFLPDTIERIGGVAVASGIIILLAVTRQMFTSYPYDTQKKVIEEMTNLIENQNKNRKELWELVECGKVDLNFRSLAAMTDQEILTFLLACKMQ